MSDDTSGIRLQKVLAAAGIASRRASEELIAAGRVSVNDETVREQGRRVDPERDVIRVDGMRINTATGNVYLALNKPRGYVTAMSDAEGRPTVGDLVRDRTERLFHVGRLDADTEGLLLLTNDGELAHRLSHPSYEVPKTYLAEVLGPVGRDVGKRLREGVELEDGFVRIDSFKLIDSTANRVLVEIVLHEGRKHIVRRALAEVGHPVQRLLRTAVGPVRLGAQKPGRIRALSREELAGLFALVGM
jgi:23S rRNA pseudouridine2605 synthase